MTIALNLTQHYSKGQILEWYLNEVPYGSVFTGIEEASERYFSIPAKDLNLAQAAFLAGLPQSPSRYDPFTNYTAAKIRQIEVLDLMAKHGFLTQAEADLTKFVDVQLQPSSSAVRSAAFRPVRRRLSAADARRGCAACTAGSKFRRRSTSISTSGHRSCWSST